MEVERVVNELLTPHVSPNQPVPLVACWVFTEFVCGYVKEYSIRLIQSGYDLTSVHRLLNLLLMRFQFN